MLSVSLLVFSGVLAASDGASGADELSFPAGFKFGVASAAYQVEGAWNVSDKSPSTWDVWTHGVLSQVADSSTADVACDSYHRWKEDVQLVHKLGVHFYRFSISWPRLLPSGFAEHVSEDGARYYNNLIDGLLEAGIEPVVTLYHWDLPQRLQDLGGWTNPLIAEWFAEYARVVYSLYGDRVKTWLTLNEPWLMCDFMYSGMFPPALSSEVAQQLCAKHALLAHARAYRLYDTHFRDKYHGLVSVPNHDMWYQAVNDTDEETAELVRQYQVGRFAHPIYSRDGGWPPSVERAMDEYSRQQGFPSSILPAFTEEEIQLVKGTADFYGLNFYNSREVRAAHPEEVLEPWPLHDLPLFRAKIQIPPRWPIIMTYFVDYPEGLRKQLAWLKHTYGDIPIFITENGRGSAGGLRDTDRVQHYNNYLQQVLLAIREDGVNVTGYTAWTLMDNFEWLAGYNTKFGLYEVDFTSPSRPRTPRLSAHYYSSVVRAHSLDVPTPEDTSTRNDIVERAGEPVTSAGGSSYLVVGGILLLVVVLAAALVSWGVRRRNTGSKGEYATVKGDPETGPNNGSSVTSGTSKI